MVYCPKPRTLDDLENNMPRQREVGLLKPNMINQGTSLDNKNKIDMFAQTQPKALFTLWGGLHRAELAV